MLHCLFPWVCNVHSFTNNWSKITLVIKLIKNNLSYKKILENLNFGVEWLIYSYCTLQFFLVFYLKTNNFIYKLYFCHLKYLFYTNVMASWVLKNITGMFRIKVKFVYCVTYYILPHALRTQYNHILHTFNFLFA